MNDKKFEKMMKEIYMGHGHVLDDDTSILTKEDLTDSAFKRWLDEMPRDRLMSFMNSLLKKEQSVGFLRGMEYQKTNRGLKV